MIYDYVNKQMTPFELVCENIPYSETSYITPYREPYENFKELNLHSSISHYDKWIIFGEFEDLDSSFQVHCIRLGNNLIPIVLKLVNNRSLVYVNSFNVLMNLNGIDLLIRKGIMQNKSGDFRIIRCYSDIYARIMYSKYYLKIPSKLFDKMEAQYHKQVDNKDKVCFFIDMYYDEKTSDLDFMNEIIDSITEYFSGTIHSIESDDYVTERDLIRRSEMLNFDLDCWMDDKYAFSPASLNVRIPGKIPLSSLCKFDQIYYGNPYWLSGFDSSLLIFNFNNKDLFWNLKHIVNFFLETIITDIDIEYVIQNGYIKNVKVSHAINDWLVLKKIKNNNKFNFENSRISEIPIANLFRHLGATNGKIRIQKDIFDVIHISVDSDQIKSSILIDGIMFKVFSWI